MSPSLATAPPSSSSLRQRSDACPAFAPTPSARVSGFIARTSAREDLLGTTVAGRVIERVVAEGGIGVVYAARAPEGQGMVAIKVLQERYADDPGIVSRFEREIAFAYRVDHPNVTSALDHG